MNRVNLPSLSFSALLTALGLSGCVDSGPPPFGTNKDGFQQEPKSDMIYDDLDYTIPDGDRVRGDLGFPLPDCRMVRTLGSTDLYNQLIAPYCTGRCHNGTGPGSGNFSATSPQEMVALWVGYPSQQSAKRRITPGDPYQSYVLDKILGIQGPPPAGIGSGSGGRMPQGCSPAAGTCFEEADACLMINWIRAGAR